MTKKDNVEDSSEEQETLHFVSLSSLDKVTGIKEKLSEIYNWKESVESTGIIDEPVSIKFIKYPFDRYNITVAISSNNEFIGITEVQLNEDFRSYKLKRTSQFSAEVEDFYFKE